MSDNRERLFDNKNRFQVSDNREELCDAGNSCTPVDVYLSRVMPAFPVHHTGITPVPGVKNKKVHVGKRVFPHLPQPPAPSLKLWLCKFFSRKLPAGLRPLSFINTRRIYLVTVLAAPNKLAEH